MATNSNEPPFQNIETGSGMCMQFALYSLEDVVNVCELELFPLVTDEHGSGVARRLQQQLERLPELKQLLQ